MEVSRESRESLIRVSHVTFMTSSMGMTLVSSGWFRQKCRGPTKQLGRRVLYWFINNCLVKRDLWDVVIFVAFGIRG